MPILIVMSRWDARSDRMTSSAPVLSSRKPVAMLATIGEEREHERG